MTELFQSLLTPFQYDYMLRAIWVSALVGGSCGFLSSFVTLKGWSLMGDALSHAVVPGVAVAYILGLPFSLGAFVAGLLAAGTMAFIKAKSRIREDATIGIVFTAYFALGLVLISLFPARVDLKVILLGNILGISDPDIVQVIVISVVTLLVLGLKWKDLMLFRSQMWQTLGLGGLVLGVTLALRRDLLLICFDPGQARVMALPDGLLGYLLLGLLSLAVVVSLQAVGIILVVAMLVTPGSIAHLLTDRFDRMLLISAAAAVSSTWVGISISYHIEGSTGGCIVLVQALLFVLSLLFSPKYGMISRRGRVG